MTRGIKNQVVEVPSKCSVLFVGASAAYMYYAFHHMYPGLCPLCMTVLQSNRSQR